MERPLNLVIEEAKTTILSTVAEIKASTHLPAVIIEGILESALAETRREACSELVVAADKEKQQFIKILEKITKQEEVKEEEPDA